MAATLKRHPAFAPATPHGWFTVDSPAGPLTVACGDRGISLVTFGEDFGAFFESFAAHVGRDLFAAESADYPEQAAALERGETAPELCDFGVISPFTRRVLEAASQIERGETRTYQWVAARIGMPRASRAVGNALGANPVPVVVPCHRVVRSDGSLGGYTYGVEIKRRLLAAEGCLTAAGV